MFSGWGLFQFSSPALWSIRKRLLFLDDDDKVLYYMPWWKGMEKASIVDRAMITCLPVSSGDSGHCLVQYEDMRLISIHIFFWAGKKRRTAVWCKHRYVSNTGLWKWRRSSVIVQYGEVSTAVSCDVLTDSWHKTVNTVEEECDIPTSLSSQLSFFCSFRHLLWRPDLWASISMPEYRVCLDADGSTTDAGWSVELHTIVTVVSAKRSHLRIIVSNFSVRWTWTSPLSALPILL